LCLVWDFPDGSLTTRVLEGREGRKEGGKKKKERGKNKGRRERGGSWVGLTDKMQDTSLNLNPR
jgi:hypothetical protein